MKQNMILLVKVYTALTCDYNRTKFLLTVTGYCAVIILQFELIYNSNSLFLLQLVAKL